MRKGVKRLRTNSNWMRERLPTKWNAFWYGVAGVFFLLMVLIFPFTPLPFHWNPITQDVVQPAPFRLDAQATITSANGTVLAKPNQTIAEGQFLLTGKGGISVNHPVTMYAEVDFFQNISDIISSVQSVTLIPLAALQYPLHNDSDNIPEPEMMILQSNGAGKWSDTTTVEYFLSGEWGGIANITTIDATGQAQTVTTEYEPSIQVSPIDVTLAIDNNLVTTSLTLAILGFAALALRKDDKKNQGSGNSPSPPESEARSQTGRAPASKGGSNKSAWKRHHNRK